MPTSFQIRNACRTTSFSALLVVQGRHSLVPFEENTLSPSASRSKK